MNEPNEENLRAEVGDLKRRLEQHEGMRSNSIDALSVVQTDVQRLQQRMIPVPAEITAAREVGMLEKYAVLATRVRAIELWLVDLTKVVLDDLGEIRDLLKRGRE